LANNEIVNFAADSSAVDTLANVPDPSAVADDAEDAVTKAANDAMDKISNCVPLVNYFDVGVISGRLFSNFFNTAVKPLQ